MTKTGDRNITKKFGNDSKGTGNTGQRKSTSNLVVDPSKPTSSNAISFNEGNELCSYLAFWIVVLARP